MIQPTPIPPGKNNLVVITSTLSEVSPGEQLVWFVSPSCTLEQKSVHDVQITNGLIYGLIYSFEGRFPDISILSAFFDLLMYQFTHTF